METNSHLKKEALTLRGTLSKQEFKKHGDYHFNKIFYTICTLFFIFSYLYFLTVIWNSEDLHKVFYYVIFALISLVFSSILLIAFKINIKLKAGREFKSDPLIKCEITYIISAQEIHQKIGRSNHYLEWKQIRKAYENNDMFRLYVSRAKAIVLPKRFFASEEEIQQLKLFITENLNKDKVNF